MAMTKANAQQGFGTSSPAPSSVVDMNSANKGVLLPRVALTGLTDITTIPSAANALTVFNTATTALGTANDVSPGYYYWNGTQWVRLLTGTEATTDWALKGNTGTTAGTNFLGTTDAQDLVFKTNSLERLRLTQTGRLLFANTTGPSANLLNVFLTGGNETTTGAANVAFGFQALAGNTTGSYNLAVGSGALTANTTGVDNIALGYQTLQSNINGADNVAIGKSALLKNTAGKSNIAVGAGSLAFNTNSNNTAVGYNTLTQSTSGINNTAIGYQAGYGIAGSTGTSSTGSNNTLIGANTALLTATASNQLNISNNIFGTGLTGTALAPAGLIGIGTTAPTTTLDVKPATGLDPVRFEGLLTGAATDNYVVANPTTGVIRTIAPAAIPTLYNGDGTINGNRTVKLGSGASLKVLDNASGDNILLQRGTQVITTTGASGRAYVLIQAGAYPFNIFVDGGTKSAEIKAGTSTVATTLDLGTIGDAPIKFTTNNTPKAIITSAGNVGIGATAPNSTLQVNGSVSLPIKTVIDDYAVTAGDYKILVNKSTLVTITLPNPTTCGGRIYVIQNFDASAPPPASSAGVAFNYPISVGRGATIAAGTAALTSINSSTGAYPNLTYLSGTTVTLQSDGAAWTGITQ